MAKQYQHILWDWNGTLLDDLCLCVEVMNRLLKKRRLPLLTPERYRDVFNFPIRDYYEALGFDFAEESFEALSIEFMDQYEALKTTCSLAPCGRELLERFQRAGIAQSILSAYPYDGLVHIVQHYRLMHFFDELLGLADIYAKSKRELGLSWMSIQSYAPSDVLMIGDTAHDFEVAEALGIDCILVANGHYSRQRLQQCPVPVLDSLEALPSMLTLS